MQLKIISAITSKMHKFFSFDATGGITLYIKYCPEEGLRFGNLSKKLSKE